MKRIKAFIAALPEEVSVTRLDFMLSIVVGALAGMVVGMLASPRKNKTIHCGNGNGNNYYGDADEPVSFEDEA